MPAPEANGPSTITGRPLPSPTGSRPPIRARRGVGAPPYGLPVWASRMSGAEEPP